MNTENVKRMKNRMQRVECKVDEKEEDRFVLYICPDLNHPG
jgi:hypothetical protein